MVLGKTGKETEVVSKRRVFCSLCRKTIQAGETCLSLDGQGEFLTHIDCKSPDVEDRMTNGEFRQHAKRRKRKRPTGIVHSEGRR